jgi:hypothetical protein
LSNPISPALSLLLLPPSSSFLPSPSLLVLPSPLLTLSDGAGSLPSSRQRNPLPPPVRYFF